MEILKTRLFKPVVTDGLIVRERLMRKMAQNQYKRFHLIIGAAGYGKSVLVSQWLDSFKANYCWISLNSDCNDIRVFLNYLMAAINSREKQFLDLVDLTLAPQLPSNKSIAQVIINSLESIKKELIIVLDDYHLIRDSNVNDIMTQIVSNFPQQHKFVIISRRDPPLRMEKLEAYDKISEIRMVDLKFTTLEIEQLSKELFTKNLDQKTLKSILEFTEGWIIPIRILVKNLNKENLNKASIEIGKKKSSRITNKLLKELFENEHPDLLESCMLASLFDRFNIPLLLIILKKEYPNRINKLEPLINLLEDFLVRSLFIIALDEEKNWYRFHHLVQDFLKKEVEQKWTKKKIVKLTQRASEYFENLGFLDEAIQLSTKTNNVLKTIDIIEKYRHSYMDKHRFDMLNRWLKLISPSVIETNAGLLLTQAMLHEHSSEYEQMFKYLELANKLIFLKNPLLENSPLLKAEFFAIKSSAAYHAGIYELAVSCATKAMDQFPTMNSYLYNFAMAYKVLSLNVLGQDQKAHEILRYHKKDIDVKDPLNLMYNQIITSILFAYQDRLDKCSYELNMSKEMARMESINAVSVMASYLMAFQCYMQNKLVESLKHIKYGLKRRYSARPLWIIQCFCLDAFCHLSQGRKSELNNTVQEMTEYVQNFRETLYHELVKAIQVELSLRQGEVETAMRLSNGVNFNPKVPTHFHYHPQLTEVKLNMARGKYQNLNRAQRLLKEYKDLGQKLNNGNFLAQVECLNIIMSHKTNNLSKKTVISFLSYTKEKEYFRFYADYYNDFERIYKQHLINIEEDSYVFEILKTIKNEERSISHLKRINRLENSNTPLDLLNQKEQEILHLISLNFQNKEIADKLNYSLGTVKTYVYKIYQKTGLKNRKEAKRFLNRPESQSFVTVKDIPPT